NYITYAGTRAGVVSVDPSSCMLEVWVKFSSGTVYFGAAEVPSDEDPNTEAAGPSKQIGWYTSAGRLKIHLNDPNGGTHPLIIIGNGGDFIGYPDGKWHYLALLLPGSSTIQYVVDSLTSSAASLGFIPSQTIGLNNFYIDATTYFWDALSSISVAYLAAYTTVLSSGQMAQHYQRGIGYLGEKSGARASRLLTQYWGAPATVAAGVA